MPLSLFAAVFMVFSLIPLAGGPFTIWKGWEMRSRSTSIRDAETVQVRDLRPGDAEVKGTVKTVDDSTLDSPFGSDDVVAYSMGVERYRSGGQEGGGGWKAIYTDEKSIPFIVDDGTGEVRVDPSSSDPEIIVEWRRTHVQPGEEPPDGIADFLDEVSEVDETDSFDLGPVSVGERRRYTEGYIEPGETVYVLGKAREEAGWDGNRHLIDTETDDGDFILSDKSEDRLVRENSLHGILFIAVGIFGIIMSGVFVFVSILFFGWL